jgi:hypothetical protein
MLLTLTSCSDESIVLPKLNTLTAGDTDVTSTTAKLKGEVLVVGNQIIVEYGIELSKSQFFSPSSKKSISGTPPPGNFEVDFTGLDPGTLYYYKAYALINTAEVYSENVKNFTTKQ